MAGAWNRPPRYQYPWAAASLVELKRSRHAALAFQIDNHGKTLVAEEGHGAPVLMALVGGPIHLATSPIVHKQNLLARGSHDDLVLVVLVEGRILSTALSRIHKEISRTPEGVLVMILVVPAEDRIVTTAHVDDPNAATQHLFDPGTLSCLEAVTPFP